MMAENQRICSVDGCGNPAKPGRKGMCGKHYKRVHRYGRPDGFAPKPERPICKVDGCGTVAQGLGFCNNHYKRFVKWGDPLAGGMTPGTIPQWVRDHAAYEGDDCLAWPFSRDRNGYGKMKIGDRGTSAHRVMCETAHGQPEGPAMHAAHSCHNGHLGCVNPRHLFWQDGSENQSNKPRQPKGKRSYSAILGPVDVLGARLLLRSRTQASVAAEFGVARTTMGQIERGEIWKSL